MVRIAEQYAPVPKGLFSDRGFNLLSSILVAISTSYNAIFAFSLAHGGPATYLMVAATESAIIMIALLLCALRGFDQSDLAPLSLIYVITLITIFVSLIGDRIFVDALRNFLIIGAFTMLGYRCDERTIRRTFVTISAIVLVVLLIEIASTKLYASSFQPAQYLASTRGIKAPQFDNSGLSIGTINYEGRFSVGLYSGPRTSSIFLEQVSINCFAIVLIIYLSSFWDRLQRRELALFLLTVGIIIITNNARMAIIISLLIAFGHRIFPLLDRSMVVCFTILLFVSVFVLFLFVNPHAGDDLIGRLSVTYNFFAHSDSYAMLGMRLGEAANYADSGYGYVISTISIFGLMALIAYVVCIVPMYKPNQSRCQWGIALYVLLWLMVGGTGTFSIKTAALLWLFVGFMRKTYIPPLRQRDLLLLSKAPPAGQINI